MWFRIASLLPLLLLLAACDQLFPPALPESTRDLVGLKGPIVVGRARVGEEVVHDLPIRNVEEVGVRVELVTDPPFSVEPERLVLGPGETARVRLRFRPREAGEIRYALGLRLRTGLKAIPLYGIAEELCDPLCEIPDGDRCMPREGTCWPDAPCAVGGTCVNGACVPVWAVNGTPCRGMCGSAVCEDGVCMPDGGVVREPEWSFARAGQMELLGVDPDGERVVVSWSFGEERQTTILTLRGDGSIESVTPPIEEFEPVGARVVGEVLVVYRHGAWLGHALSSGAALWRRRAVAQPEQPLVGETLYLIDTVRRLAALDVITGAPRWERELDRLEGVRIAADESAVFVVGTGDGNHRVRAFDPATGAERWTRQAPGSLQRFLPDGAGGYFASVCGSCPAGEIQAVAGDGRLRWSVEVAPVARAGEGWRVNGPRQRLAGDGLLLLDGEVLDRSTGSHRYVAPVGDPLNAHFLRVGRNVLALDALSLTSYWDAVLAFDAATGEVLDRVPLEAGVDGFVPGVAETALVAARRSSALHLCEVDEEAALRRTFVLDEEGREGVGKGLRLGDRWIELTHDRRLDRSTVRAWRIAGD